LSLPPIGDVTRPGRTRLRIAVHTGGIGRTASPEVVDLTLKTARLLEELGHHVEQVEHPAPATVPEDFLLYWAMLAMTIVRTGRRVAGPTWERTRLDNLTLGLDRHCRRRIHLLPGAIARLRRLSRISGAFHERYDVALTPTLAHATPRVGHLDPANDFYTVMERILEWVAFTPWHNATGDPAISLPLATTSTGMPQGMMLAAGAGRDATLLELAYELEEAAPWPRITD
jgi:amidase